MRGKLSVERSIGAPFLSSVLRGSPASGQLLAETGFAEIAAHLKLRFRLGHCTMQVEGGALSRQTIPSFSASTFNARSILRSNLSTCSNNAHLNARSIEGGHRFGWRQMTASWIESALTAEARRPLVA